MSCSILSDPRLELASDILSEENNDTSISLPLKIKCIQQHIAAYKLKHSDYLALAQ